MLRRLQARRCAQTGGRLWKTAEIDHRVPLFRVWREQRDTPWPELLSYWGVPNLQVINRDVHAAKCAEEAKARIAAAAAKAAGRKRAAEPLSAYRRQHPQRVQIGVQDQLVLLPLLGVLLAQADHGAQRLDVEAVALRFGIDVADVVGDGLLLFLQPLDPLDEGLQLVLGETGLGGFGLLFFDGGHQTLLMVDRAETVPAVSP